MPRYTVETNYGSFDVELDREPESDEELSQTVSQYAGEHLGFESPQEESVWEKWKQDLYGAIPDTIEGVKHLGKRTAQTFKSDIEQLRDYEQKQFKPFEGTLPEYLMRQGGRAVEDVGALLKPLSFLYPLLSWLGHSAEAGVRKQQELTKEPGTFTPYRAYGSAGEGDPGEGLQKLSLEQARDAAWWIGKTTEAVGAPAVPFHKALELPGKGLGRLGKALGYGSEVEADAARISAIKQATISGVGEAVPLSERATDLMLEMGLPGVPQARKAEIWEEIRGIGDLLLGGKGGQVAPEAAEAAAQVTGTASESAGAEMSPLLRKVLRTETPYEVPDWPEAVPEAPVAASPKAVIEPAPAAPRGDYRPGEPIPRVDAQFEEDIFEKTRRLIAQQEAKLGKTKIPKKTKTPKSLKKIMGPAEEAEVAAEAAAKTTVGGMPSAEERAANLLRAKGQRPAPAKEVPAAPEAVEAAEAVEPLAPKPGSSVEELVAHKESLKDELVLANKSRLDPIEKQLKMNEIEDQIRATNQEIVKATETRAAEAATRRRPVKEAPAPRAGEAVAKDIETRRLSGSPRENISEAQLAEAKATGRYSQHAAPEELPVTKDDVTKAARRIMQEAGAYGQKMPFEEAVKIAEVLEPQEVRLLMKGQGRASPEEILHQVLYGQAQEAQLADVKKADALLEQILGGGEGGEAFRFTRKGLPRSRKITKDFLRWPFTMFSPKKETWVETLSAMQPGYESEVYKAMHPTIRNWIKDRLFVFAKSDVLHRMEPGTAAAHQAVGLRKSLVRMAAWFDDLPQAFKIASGVHEGGGHGALWHGIQFSWEQAKELARLGEMTGELKLRGYLQATEGMSGTDLFAQEVFSRMSQAWAKSQLGMPVMKNEARALQRWVEMLEGGEIRFIPERNLWIDSPKVANAQKLREVTDPQRRLDYKEFQQLTWADRLRRVTNVETARLADRMPHMSLEDIEVLKAYNAHEILKVGQDAEARVEQARAAIANAKGGGEILDILKNTMESLTPMDAVRAEGGRALQIMKTLKGLDRKTEFLEQVQAYINKMGPDVPTENVLKFMSDLEAKAATLRQGNWFDKLHTIWINGLLSSPWTHVTNQVSNAAILMARPVTRFNEAVVERAKWAGTLGKHKPQAFFSDAVEDFSAAVTSVPEAWKRMMETWKTGNSIFRSTTKLEQVRGQFPFVGKGGQMYTPGRALVAGDEFWKVLSYQGSRAAQANRAAKLGKIPEAGSKAFKLWEDGLLKTAFAEADRTTYTNKLPYWAENLGKARTTKVGRFIVPFYNTPLNVGFSTLEHTPVFGFLRRQRVGEHLGNTTRIAKQMTGAMGATMAYLATQATGGKITGGGPRDPAAFRVWLAEGNEPYSIQFPGQAPINYRDLTGISAVLGFIGDAHDLLEEGFVDVSDVAYRGLNTFAEQFANPAFPTALSNLLDALKDDRAIPKFMQNMARSVVPRGVQAVQEGMDPTYRRPVNPQENQFDIFGLGQTIQAQVPGAAEGVPAIFDYWGRPIKRGSGALQMLGLQNISEETPNHIKDMNREIKRLMDATGRGISGVADDLKVPLTPQEYAQYAQRAGELAQVEVTSVINSSTYRNLRTPDQQLAMIRQAFSKARTQARKELYRGNVDFRQRYKEEVRKTRLPKAPGKALEALRAPRLPSLPNLGR